MKAAEYTAVKNDDAPSGVDRGTASLALVVSLLSCLVSLMAIGYVVASMSKLYGRGRTLLIINYCKLKKLVDELLEHFGPQSQEASSQRKKSN